MCIFSIGLRQSFVYFGRDQTNHCMLDEEFFTAMGGVMRALREFAAVDIDIKELICEDVLEILSEEQISGKLWEAERLKECLFPEGVEVLEVPEAFEVFKDMLLGRDFRVSESLLEGLGRLFEESITKFRPHNERDKDMVRTMIAELRRL